MNYQEYKQLFDDLLEAENPVYPYTDEMYLSYTKLNRSRVRRWDKQLHLDDVLVQKLQKMSTPQHWIIITEPWCGDAAHIVPFLMVMVDQNPLITYDIYLRDTEPFLIDSYLTAGTKSIPKLVVRDANGEDIFDWGPRPKGAQELVNQLKLANADFEEMKTALQYWYNEEQGKSLCKEIAEFYP